MGQPLKKSFKKDFTPKHAFKMTSDVVEPENHEIKSGPKRDRTFLDIVFIQVEIFRQYFEVA